MTYAISTAGLALIQEHEGFRSMPEQMPDGGWLVGYSHVRAGEAGPNVTEQEALDLLTMDVAPVERTVNALLKPKLTQSQFDALVSFAFSIGLEAFAESQVLRRVNEGDFVAAACAMDAWRKVEMDDEAVVSDTLVRRRAAEKALFLKDVAFNPAPSAASRPKLDHAASILGAPLKPAAFAPAARPTLQLVTTSAAIEDAVAPTPVFEPAVRLTEILRSEPQTEALLLTQVANDSEVDSDEDEIVTAHAKPVARPLDDVREATRRAYAAQGSEKKGFRWFAKKEQAYTTSASTLEIKPDRRLRKLRESARRGEVVKHSLEHFGLAALLVFGLVLIAIGGSLVFNGDGGVIEMLGAAGVATPGLAATLMAAYGFWRSPRTETAAA